MGCGKEPTLGDAKKGLKNLASPLVNLLDKGEKNLTKFVKSKNK